jgi:hypothetical protein
MSGEQAVVSQLVRAGGRQERHQARDEIVRIEDDVAAPVAEGALHPIPHPSVGVAGQAVERDGRTAGVAQESLETLAVVLVDGDAGMKGEAVETRA